jgi:Pin2-interacting protein X1
MAAVVKADTQNASWQNTKQTTFAYKMMQKMGWSEGKGLGKLEDGINTHVRVQKREGSLGLGAARDRDGSAGWSSTAVSFSAVLANLNKAYKPAKSKKDKKKKKKSSSSSSTEADAVVGDSAAVAADGISGGKAKVCQSRARRVKAKDIRTFSSADLKAILGQSSSAAVAYPVVSAYSSSSTTAVTSTTTVTSSSSSSSGKRKRDKETDSSEETNAERKARKAKRRAEKAAAADSDDS